MDGIGYCREWSGLELRCQFSAGTGDWSVHPSPLSFAKRQSVPSHGLIHSSIISILVPVLLSFFSTALQHRQSSLPTGIDLQLC
jgi:hypothetical protein